MPDYVKKPCKHCPFRKDVKPFLHPSRAEDIAYATQNRFATFPCHQTTDFDDDDERIATGKEKECAGFLTMRALDACEDDMPEGFTPSFDMVYDDVWMMIEAYQDQWDRTHKVRQ